jgi:hypothetical protein
VKASQRHIEACGAAASVGRRSLVPLLRWAAEAWGAARVPLPQKPGAATSVAEAPDWAFVFFFHVTVLQCSAGFGGSCGVFCSLIPYIPRKGVEHPVRDPRGVQWPCGPIPRRPAPFHQSMPWPQPMHLLLHCTAVPPPPLRRRSSTRDAITLMLTFAWMLLAQVSSLTNTNRSTRQV